MPTQLAEKTRFLIAVGVLLLPHTSFSPENSINAQAAREKRVSLRVEVTGGEPAVPVANATVYVKPEGTPHFDPPTSHTDREGVARVPNVPRGKVLIQVTKTGWRNFGQHYDLDQEGSIIKITLEREPAPKDR